jgi:ribonuclease Z
MFIITILGNNSAIPAHGRNPTAQVLQIANELYLIDCGEGTQSQMTKYNIKRNRIDHIFISHLHGDHFFGLIALLNTFSLLKRAQPLTIYCHEPLKEIIDLQLKHGGTQLSYIVNYHFLPDTNEVILVNKDITVQIVQLQHRIKCVGFVFREKPKDRKIIKERTDKYRVPVSKMADLKKGFDFVDDKGTIIANNLLTENPAPSKSYAYISDTKFLPEIVEYLKGVDVLYHESTFKNNDEQRAIETYHCTVFQAATIAKMAEVKQLYLGHYSAKYKDENLHEMLLQAKEVFVESYLSIEGETIEI